jgi:RimJ/RimL family protein N-acetyltransferase
MTNLEIDSTFESERLNFIPTWKIDAKEISQQANNLEIAAAIGNSFPFPYNETDAENFKSYTEKSWQSGEEFCFAIVKKETEKYIGNLGFKISENGETVENVGYWFGVDFHGKGFATESLKSVLDFIKEKFPKVKEVKAFAFSYNIASQNVLKKCGFKETGTLVRHKSEDEKLRNGQENKSVTFVLNF